MASPKVTIFLLHDKLYLLSQKECLFLFSLILPNLQIILLKLTIISSKLCSPSLVVSDKLDDAFDYMKENMKRSSFQPHINSYIYPFRNLLLSLFYVMLSQSENRLKHQKWWVSKLFLLDLTWDLMADENLVWLVEKPRNSCPLQQIDGSAFLSKEKSLPYLFRIFNEFCRVENGSLWLV